MSNSIAAYRASDLAYPEADSNLDSKLRDSTSAVPCSDEADSRPHTSVHRKQIQPHRNVQKLETTVGAVFW